MASQQIWTGGTYPITPSRPPQMGIPVPQLLAGLHSHGRLTQVGVEGTGAYGAALARHLHAEGV